MLGATLDKHGVARLDEQAAGRKEEAGWPPVGRVAQVVAIWSRPGYAQRNRCFFPPKGAGTEPRIELRIAEKASNLGGQFTLIVDLTAPSLCEVTASRVKMCRPKHYKRLWIGCGLIPTVCRIEGGY